ncbi:type I methionyl aminopeptidase [Herbinix luporum]|jgi:methionyl aminopeptidase|uniref:Methionine aminopeptidase n=1 Tax=Herbinix luporum TaxID=1679721 RepID=A0A0K8J2Z6_9FIRM|nr:type I methionyl aminopeptidase [Herbinix luporum]MDI9489496.1 type I methionyl aminopeptidase [Bacillota bacterium]CUH91892.1 Methionine aminopeptidase [Herbinix luporum]HHT57163.1 type I methionyl aminopeptidase [Herbinix luporum]
MPISIKSEKEIKLMEESGRILAKVHEELEKLIRPGITTLEIDKKCYEIIKSFGCIPSFLNYNGYPASLCISINDEVVHGIPDTKHILKEGDIVSLDCGVIYEGYHSDAARTVPVGEISEEAKKLIEVTKQSFFEGIKFAKAGNYLHEISEAIQTYVESFGFSVVRDLVGHGIGRNLHEEPQVPNFKQRNRGPKLAPGMTLAIEPMVNAGRCDVYWLDNDWTVVTEDGSLSAHYENTVLITDNEPKILTIL